MAPGVVGVDAERTRAAFVYLARDKDGDLLYVGLSGTSERLATHSRYSAWWPLVANLEIEHCPTRAEAASREAELIKAHRPPWNVMLIGGPTAAEVANVAPGCLTIEGVAAYLRVTPRWVADHAAEIGGHEVLIRDRPVHVFPTKELRAWINASIVRP